MTYYTWLRYPDGSVHYFEFDTNPNGVWSDGRVDYRTQSREVSQAQWELDQAVEALWDEE